MTTPITDKQRAILEAAAGRPDGLAAPPVHLPPALRGAVAKGLLKAGLLEPAGTAGDDQQDLAWRVDGAAVLLRINGAGREAIGGAHGTAQRAAVKRDGLTEDEVAEEQDLAKAALEPGIDRCAPYAREQAIAADLVAAEAHEKPPTARSAER
jgi:hypothetical protein